MAGDRVLLFGGTFDPVHHGHLIVCVSVAEQLGVDRVVLIPAGRPPHKPGEPVTAGEHRLAMLRLAVAGDGRFEVSDCELEREGPSYTLDTVRYFRGVYGAGTELFWLIGGDSLAELGTWHEAGRIVEECTVVTAVRRGYGLGDLGRLGEVFTAGQISRLREYALDTPRVDISATEVRARAAAGRSVRYLVPRGVEEYIGEKKLYREG